MKTDAGPTDIYLFEEALLAMDRETAFSIAAPYTNPSDLADNLLVPCLESIDLGWVEGRVALAQVYLSAQICEDILQEVLSDNGDAKPSITEQIAIVLLEDYHSLGKMIVRSALLAAGYSVLDFGRMEVEEIVARLKESSIELLLVSVLMLPSAHKVAQLKQRLEEESIPTKLIVGGAPFRLDQKLWQEVGADGFGAVASDAIDIVKRILREKP